MRTWYRVCIEDYAISDGDAHLTIERAKEYITSDEKDGTVTVFSTFWAYGVPVSIFAGERQNTPASRREDTERV